jgi:hypothetical protein
MISLNGLSDQIKTIIAEHKDCGGHCHSWGQPNNGMNWEKDNEHLSSILTYYVWGVLNGIHSVH